MVSPCSTAQPDTTKIQDRVFPQECVRRAVVTSHVLAGTPGFSLEFSFWELAPAQIDD